MNPLTLSSQPLARKGPTMTDIAGLCERLRAVESSRGPSNWSGIREVTTNWHRNPDGTKAADALERLAAEIERLREALRNIKALPDLSKNPADDFDRGARAARLDAADIAQAALTGEDTATLGLSGKTQTRGDACTS